MALEVKAAYLVMQKFRHYLLGIKFTLVTDCAGFKQTTTKKDFPQEVARWIFGMQDYNYEVVHRSGGAMKHGDFLSRYHPEVLVISTELTARTR